VQNADRVFCIYSEQAPAKGRKAEAKTPGEQRTLEAIGQAGRARPGGGQPIDLFLT